MTQDVVRLVPVLLTWAAVLCWLPAAWRQSSTLPTRFFWLALLLFAAGMTLLLPAVYATVDAALGVANLARPLSHSLIIAASWSSLAMLYHLNFEAQAATPRIWRVGWLALVAAGLLFALFAVSDAAVEEPVAFTDRYADALPIVAYRLVFLAYVGMMLVDVVRLTWRYGGLSRTRPALRLGMRVTAVGGLGGLGYVTHGVLYLVDRHLGWGYPVPDAPASTLLGAISVTLVVVGATLPAWGSRLVIPAVYRWLDQYAACQRLYPLWRDLCHGVPDIALSPVPSPIADALDVRDVGFRLSRRVVEIRDARLMLSTCVPPGTTERALTLGSEAGLAGERLRALVEATCLRAALHAREDGVELSTSSGMPPTVAATALADEIAFLALVADAYQRSPVVRAIIDNAQFAAAPSV